MPKISVNEKDLSWYYRQRESSALTVYMPLLATFGPEEPVLTDKSNFSRVFGTSPTGADKDMSYKIAASFIKSGINVLGHRFVPSGATPASTTQALVEWSNPTADAIAVTIGGSVYTVPKGATSISISAASHDLTSDTVTAAFTSAKITGAKVSGVKLLSDNLEITAKYAGTFGNSLKVKIKKATPYYYIHVQDTTGYTLETLTVSLDDPTSPKYYELVNNDATYVTIDVVDLSENTFLKDGSKLNEVVLAGGSDGDLSKAYGEVCAAITHPTALTDLLDPYQYSFNVVHSGGFNTYSEKIIATLNAESWSVIFSKELPSAITVNDITIPKDSLSYGLGSDMTKTQAAAFVASAQTELDKLETSATGSATNIDVTLNNLAASASKAFYLIDGASDWDDKMFFSYCGLDQFNNSYVAAYGPWGYAQYISDGSQALLPGSYALLISWAQSLAEGTPLWMAPAGAKRAQLGSFYKAPKYKIGSTILDTWQNHEYVSGTTANYKVNPIMKLRQYGYCIYGDSTLLHNRPDGSTSQLQTLSVRVLCNMIKEQAFDVSLGLQFDKITNDLIAQFKALMSVFMDQLKYGGALYGYNIVADYSALTLADLNTKRVPVKIQISPNPDAENFDVNLEVSQSGISFNDDTDETETA